MVASASAGVIVVGLSSSLYISAQAIDVDNGASARTMATERALGLLLADVEHALAFKQRTTTALEFTVPDRDEDGRPESLLYSWSGNAGDPLVRSLNGGTTTTLLRDVQELDFVSLTRSASSIDVTVSPDPKWPVVEGHTISVYDSEVSELGLETPAGLVDGELMVAGLMFDNLDAELADMVAAPAGWIPLALFQNDDKVSLGLWWKKVDGAEPAVQGWRPGESDYAIGMLIRISNQHDTSPIGALAIDEGQSNKPTAPSADTTNDHSLVLRFGVFDHDKLDLDSPGPLGHTVLFAGVSDTKMSGAIGHKMQRAAGDTGTSIFCLTRPEEFCSATLVIAPRED